MANVMMKSKKDKIIICDFKDDCSNEQYKKYIEHINADLFGMGATIAFSPHYVIDQSGKWLELLDPDYIGDATGHKDIDYSAISIVRTGKELNITTQHRLADLIQELWNRYPDIPQNKYSYDGIIYEERIATEEDLKKYGVFPKTAFPELS